MTRARFHVGDPVVIMRRPYGGPTTFIDTTVTRVGVRDLGTYDGRRWRADGYAWGQTWGDVVMTPEAATVAREQVADAARAVALFDSFRMVATHVGRLADPARADRASVMARIIAHRDNMAKELGDVDAFIAEQEKP